MAFNGDVMHELASQFLALADKGSNGFYAVVVIMFGESICGTRQIR